MIERIYEAQDKSRGSTLTSKDIELAVKIVIEQLTSSLASGRRVEIRGFGSFSLRYRAPRLGRNPKTGEEMDLEARTVVTLKGTHKCDNKLNTGDLIETLTNNEKLSSFNYKVIKDSVNLFLNILRSVPLEKYRVEIRGFGVFFPTLVSSKWSRNPKTGEKVFVDEHMKLSFKLSKVLKRELN